jgi:hypothetical protein
VLDVNSILLHSTHTLLAPEHGVDVADVCIELAAGEGMQIMVPLLVPATPPCVQVKS